jgi:hypothetical protein
MKQHIAWHGCSRTKAYVTVRLEKLLPAGNKFHKEIYWFEIERQC